MKDGFLMKKLCLLLLTILLIAGIAACGGGDEPEDEVLVDAAVDEPVEQPAAPEPAPAETVEPEALEHDENEDVPDDEDEVVEREPFVGEFDWTMEPAPGWMRVDIADLYIFASPLGSGSHLHVHVDTAQGMNLDEFVDFNLDIMEDVFANFYLHANDRMEINGKDARLLVFETTTIPGVYRTYQFFIVAGETVFVIGYSRMPGADYFDDVLQMLDTFTIFSRD